MKSPAQVQPAPLLREYYSRVLAYIATAASIAAGTYTQHFTYDILWMVPYALLYPHLAYHLGNRLKQNYPEQTELGLLFIDAAHAGAAAVLMGFSVAPGLMLLLILSFSSLIAGGLRRMGLALLTATGSMALVTSLAHPAINAGRATRIARKEFQKPSAEMSSSLMPSGLPVIMRHAPVRDRWISAVAGMAKANHSSRKRS